MLPEEDCCTAKEMDFNMLWRRVDGYEVTENVGRVVSRFGFRSGASDGANHAIYLCAVSKALWQRVINVPVLCFGRKLRLRLEVKRCLTVLRRARGEQLAATTELNSFT